jgi:hypothetical protein
VSGDLSWAVLPWRFDFETAATLERAARFTSTPDGRQPKSELRRGPRGKLRVSILRRGQPESTVAVIQEMLLRPFERDRDWEIKT